MMWYYCQARVNSPPPTHRSVVLVPPRSLWSFTKQYLFFVFVSTKTYEYECNGRMHKLSKSIIVNFAIYDVEPPSLTLNMAFCFLIINFLCVYLKAFHTWVREIIMFYTKRVCYKQFVIPLSTSPYTCLSGSLQYFEILSEEKLK